jgi:hypothetical protein
VLPEQLTALQIWNTNLPSRRSINKEAVIWGDNLITQLDIDKKWDPKNFEWK